MFKSFIKYTFFFKESDSTKTSEQADNLIHTTILSALRRRRLPYLQLSRHYRVANNPNYISALMNAPQAFTRRCAVCPHSLLGKFKESDSIK